jgi:hypothetical protein
LTEYWNKLGEAQKLHFPERPSSETSTSRDRLVAVLNFAQPNNATNERDKTGTKCD